MFKSLARSIFIASTLTTLVLTISYVRHENDPVTPETGVAEIYIDDHGLEVAGDNAVVIAKAGSTVVLYKNAQLVDTEYGRFSMRADFAFNFDERFAMRYASDAAVPIVWASRTIARKGSLIMAGAGSKILAEDGAIIIFKNTDAPAFLWDTQDDARVTYARAQHEVG